MIDVKELRPSDLIGTNKDSYLILEKLPAEFDSRVKAMEVDERPTEEYSDIGGCDKQIQELIEAVVLPMTHKDMFESIGIRPPKGVLLHGPPGTVSLSMILFETEAILYDFTSATCLVYHVIFLRVKHSWLEHVPIKLMRSFSN